MEDQSPISTLYGNLIQDGYDLPDEVEFRKSLRDPEKLRVFHENLVADGYELPDISEVRGMIRGEDLARSAVPIDEAGLPAPVQGPPDFVEDSGVDPVETAYNAILRTNPMLNSLGDPKTWAGQATRSGVSSLISAGAGLLGYAAKLFSAPPVLPGTPISEIDFDARIKPIDDLSKSALEASSIMQSGAQLDIKKANKMAGVSDKNMSRSSGELILSGASSGNFEDMADGFRGIGVQAVAQIPQLLALMYSGGGTNLGTFTAGSSMGVGAAAASEYSDKGEIDDAGMSKTLIMGLIEGVSEMVFKTDLKAMRSAVMGQPSKEIQKAIKNGLWSSIKNALSGAGEEGLEEVVAGLAQYITDVAYGDDVMTPERMKQKSVELFEQFMVGATVGGGASGSAIISSLRAQPQSVRDQINKFNEIASNENLPDDVRLVTKKKAIELESKVKEAASREYSKIASLPVEDRAELSSNISKAERLRDSLANIDDPDIVSLVGERISALDRRNQEMLQSAAPAKQDADQVQTDAQGQTQADVQDQTQPEPQQDTDVDIEALNRAAELKKKADRISQIVTTPPAPGEVDTERRGVEMSGLATAVYEYQSETELKEAAKSAGMQEIGDDYSLGAFVDANGSIHFSSESMNRGDLIHENSHVVTKSVKITNPELYNAMVTRLMESEELAPYREIVKRNYPELFEGDMDIDAIFEESMAFMTQENGVNELNKLDESARSTVVSTLMDIWNGLLQAIGITPKDVGRTTPLDITWGDVQDLAGMAKRVAKASTSGAKVKLNIDTTAADVKPLPDSGKPAASKRALPNISEDTTPYLTIDDNQNVDLIHMGNIEGGFVDPSRFGSNAAEADVKSGYKTPVSMFYTRPIDIEPRFRSAKRNDIKFPADRLYDFTYDPLDFYPEAERRFKEAFGEGQIFTPVRQINYMSEVLRENGYAGIIAWWNGKRRVDIWEPVPLTSPSASKRKVDKKQSASQRAESIAQAAESVKSNSGRLYQDFKDATSFGFSMDRDGNPYDPNAQAEPNAKTGTPELPDIVTLASRVYPVGDITPELIAEMMVDYADVLAESDRTVVGVYRFEDGIRASIDVNVSVPLRYRDNSVAFAKSNNQEAIYSYSDDGMVDTGGSGSDVMTTKAQAITAIQNLLAGRKYTAVDDSASGQRFAETGAHTGKTRADKNLVGQMIEKFLDGVGIKKLARSELRKSIDNQAEAILRAVRSAINDINYQLLHAEDTGLEWYLSDIGYFYDQLQKFDPDFKNDPGAMGVFSAVLAITSNGTNPSDNTKLAWKIWNLYKRDGVFYSRNPEVYQAKKPDPKKPKKNIEFYDVYDYKLSDNGNTVSGVDAKGNPVEYKTSQGYKLENKAWGARGEITGLNTLTDMVKKMGHEGTYDFLMSTKSFDELKQWSPNIKTWDDRVPGEGDTIYGSHLFGAKLGAFFQNINGNLEPLTVDLWMTRTWGRWLNSLNKGSEVAEQPTGADREMMRHVFDVLKKQYDLTTAELQAVLWYYEQKLWSAAGGEQLSLSYIDGIQKIAELEGIQLDPKPAFAAEAKKRGETAVSKAILAINAERGRDIRLSIRAAGREKLVSPVDIRLSKRKKGGDIIQNRTVDRIMNDTSGRYSALKPDISSNKSLFEHEAMVFSDIADEIARKTTEQLESDFPSLLASGMFKKGGDMATGMLYGAQLLNNYVAGGQTDKAIMVLKDLSDVGTNAGQILRALADLKTSTAEGYMFALESMLQSKGLSLTSPQFEYYHGKVTQLLDLKRAASSAVDSLLASTDPSLSADLNKELKRLSIMINNLENNLHKDTNRLIPIGLSRTVEQMMQGNALTIKSLIVNPAANMVIAPFKTWENFWGDTFKYIADRAAGKQTSFPFFKAVAAANSEMFSPMVWYDAAKKGFLGHDRFGAEKKLDVQYGFLDSFGTTKDMFFATFAPQSAQGKQAEMRRARSKRVELTTIDGKKYKGDIVERTETGAVVLRTKSGRDILFDSLEISKIDAPVPRSVFAEDMMNLMPQAMVADAMFRALILGDYSFRKAAEAGEAVRWYYENVPKEKRSKDHLQELMMAPPVELRDRMKIAGDEQVLTGDHALSSFINLVDNYMSGKIDSLGSKGPVAAAMAAAAAVVKRSVLLFKTVPANLSQMMLEYAIPILPLSNAVMYATNKRGNNDMRAAGREFGKFLAGGTLWFLGSALYSAGVLMAVGRSDDEEERDAKMAIGGGAGAYINMTAISRLFAGDRDWNAWRPNDYTMSVDKLGVGGWFFAFYAKYRDILAKQGKPFTMSADQVEVGVMAAFDQAISQDFLQGAHTILKAMSTTDGQPLADLASTATFPIVPNQFTHFMRSEREIALKRNARDLVDKIQVDFANRVQNSPTDKLVPLIDALGEPVRQTPEGAGKLTWNVIDILKFKKYTESDQAWLELSKMWNTKKLESRDPLLTPPSRGFKLEDVELPGGRSGNISISLQPIEYAQAQILAGQIKKWGIMRLMEDPEWSTLSDDEKWDLVKELDRDGNSQAADIIGETLAELHAQGRIIVDFENKTYDWVGRRDWFTNDIADAVSSSEPEGAGKQFDIESFYRFNKSEQ
jgi:hypothetical protein